MFRGTAVFASFGLSLLVAQAAVAGQCEKTFDNTFDLIQEAIFESHGCTEATCHGAQAEGGLDLRAGVAYDNLIDQPPGSIPASQFPGMARVTPGQKDLSLLWFNLAAGTLPEEWRAPLRAMPLALPPLSVDELEAVRLWIEHGAPRDETVPGTGDLLDACLPDPKPIVIAPLPPPEAGTGVQFQMPRWTVPPHGEAEVCFVSYFDVTDQVPEQFLGPGGQTFRYYRNQIRQNPGSHHLIVSTYIGPTAVDDPVWGPFTCKGGPDDGKSCAPKDPNSCAGDGLCGSEPQTSIACTGHGPADAFANSPQFSGTQESSSSLNFPDGVYGEIPLKGIIVWNSHAFNLTDEDGPIDAWLNFEFAADQERPAGNIFDISQIFKMRAAPFTADEVCNHHILPRNARLFELGSHMHKRGKRFRIFDGMFTCRGGANNGEACSPYGPDEDFETEDICAGAPCEANAPPPLGDCDGDLLVSVSDLVIGVNIALETQPMSRCADFDKDGSGSVTVAELVSAVRAALNPTLADADDSLLYSSFIYDDPVTLRFDPPLEFPDTQKTPARALTYCAVYDNGFTDPDQVKKKSTSPLPPNGTPIGGPCGTPIGCTEGNVGATCSGASADARDASCDSSPGAGDGVCDACMLRGGVTTEDEMFVLLGLYYIQ